MADNDVGGGASEGSAHTQQPGVTPEDLGREPEHVSPEDIVIAAPDDVAAPPAAPDTSTTKINADLVDDPEELARTIEEATGSSATSVEIVSESDAHSDQT